MSTLSDISSAGGAAGVVIPFPREPWITKKQLAEYLGYSVRWVELRVREGMPRSQWPGAPRFKISAVEAWLAAQGGAR